MIMVVELECLEDESRRREREAHRSVKRVVRSQSIVVIVAKVVLK
jgi:hypothetical protein